MLVPVATATAAKSLKSCPTVRPQRRQPTRLPHPGDSPGKNTGVGCHFLLQCMKVKSESEVKMKSLSRIRLLAAPWTAAYQAPPPMGFSRQEYWSGVPLPSLGEQYTLNKIHTVFWKQLAEQNSEWHNSHDQVALISQSLLWVYSAHHFCFQRLD